MGGAQYTAAPEARAMVSLSDHTNNDVGVRQRNTPASRAIVLDVDRRQAFNRARRHSWMVRTLRVALPVSSLLLVAGYVTMVVTTARIGAGIDRKTQVTTLGRELTMDNPRYEGITQDGGRFLVLARTAIPDFVNQGRIKLNAITGELYDVRKARTDVTATRGVFDSKANRLDLADGITVVTDAGMKAELETATILTREGTLTSQTPARVSGPQGTIRSNRLELNQKTKQIAFIDEVIARLTPPPPAPEAVATAAAAVATGTKPASALAAFGGSKSPVDVTSDRLDIDDVAKTAVFSGRVKAGQAEAQMETERLEIIYLGQVAQPAQPSGGNSQPGTAPATPAGPARIERILSPGPVVLSQGAGGRVTGNSATFDTIGETALVAGNVTMTSGPDRRATSETAEFNQKADTILLSGNVVVTQATNELRGRRLFLDRKSGRTELSSPAEGALPKSRIFAHLTQGAAQPGKSAKKAGPSPAAAAQTEAETGGLGFATFKTDPNAPVEVEADRLVAEDKRKDAVFTGDVRAAQGDFLIKSNELKAFYTGDTGLVSDPVAGAAAGAKTPAQLNRIEARGKVTVSSKAGQQVTGDWAIFDTKANTVTVGGDEVVLTQGPNIVRGNKLLIDMTTGQSVITREGTPATATAPARPGRSSVVFYPSSQEKGAKKPPPPAKPAASGWGATAEPVKPQ